MQEKWIGLGLEEAGEMGCGDVNAQMVGGWNEVLEKMRKGGKRKATEEQGRV